MRPVDRLIDALLDASAAGERIFLAQRDRETWIGSPFPYADDPQLVVRGPDVIALCDHCEGERERRERAGTLGHVERLVRLPPGLSDHISRLVASGEFESADAYLAALIQGDEIQRRII